MDVAPDRIAIIDITDASGYARIPPCSDPGFDHRSCDYWEDADRGSKTIRLDWLTSRGASGASAGGASGPASGDPATPSVPANPFLAELEALRRPPSNAFLTDDDDPLEDNPFAPKRAARSTVDDGAPRKLRLLSRGLGIAGSYAKVLLLDDEPAVYCQFGPLTAYPRAQRTRDLYPALPDAPLPAVVTCIASTRSARGLGLAQALIEAVCADLAGRGFSAVETYPTVGADSETTSAASPAFWGSVGFAVAAPDERFPVMRRELV
jgi:GNAT superfamily N-acetyltransferase